MTIVRRLAPDDAVAYRALMLDAYGRHPDAFTSTVAERDVLPIDWWAARLDAAPEAQSLVFGSCDADGRLCGVAGLTFGTRVKTRHKADLFGMYVPPDARGRGHGDRLVDAVLDAAAARDGVFRVLLTVTDGNRSAEALYARHGFVRYGLEAFAVAVPGGFVAKVLMVCDLTGRRPLPILSDPR